MEAKMIKSAEKPVIGYRPKGWVRKPAEWEIFTDQLLDLLRENNGCQALVRNNELYAVVYKGGKFREIDLGLTYIGDWGFSGPGRLVFIPDDPTV
jgi:hypothetical protein